MSRKKVYLMIMCFFMVFLVACGKNVEEDKKEEKIEESNSNVEDKNLNNLDDKIELAHKAASYFYFDNTREDYYDKEIYIKGERENDIWYKIKDERFNSIVAAQKYLGEYFSNEIIDMILGQAFRNEYIRKKGEDLYIKACLKDRFISKVESKIKEESEDKIVYNIDVKYFDAMDADSYKKIVFEAKDYEFICEKLENKWIFTKFSYVW